ncbi:hypothetical protein NXS19_007619 [Fusarium pseudograminearum]|nr:hypothetical protein NXS19_007619 [Fusarium pseudograminearum]
MHSQKLSMPRNSNNRPEPQTQPVLGAASSSSSSSSLFDGRFSRAFVGPANKPTTVFALIKSRICMQTRRKLGKMGLRKGSDLRARFKAREATSEGQGKPVVSAPFVAPQQHPLSNTNDPTYGDRQPSSRQSIQYSKLGHQRESLGSHPVHIAPRDRYNDDDNQLCETPSLSREAQAELLKVVMDLELQIEKATIAANMYFHQAHGWAPQSPIPDDLDSLPQMLQGLYAVMTWMQQRIQVYETMAPRLRGH